MPNDKEPTATETPAKPKPKFNPRPVPTKAELAAQKRVDKTVIKRMRKR